jgi:serpin B
MEQAFINGVADFSGISKEVSSISEAYHKTFIKVTEKGTEMAAATAVAMSKGVSMGSHFRADHPFSCFIVDSTSDLVLGMGRVTEPKE